MKMFLLLLIIVLGVIGVWGWSRLSQSGQWQFAGFDSELFRQPPASLAVSDVLPDGTSPSDTVVSRSTRTITVTNGVTHSIPLDEILSGGPGKDGIPSIDEPHFLTTKEATYLNDTDPGIGLTVGEESRFYPYRILVWHEIVNDVVAGKSVLVTYCPLCATGIVFDRMINGIVQEFGVSGRLWQSNLLMYNRAAQVSDESLWSQVLGEAVVGPDTGARLTVLRSDITRFGEWRQAHPGTLVLSEDTGAARDYGRDPYGNYYSSESVSFGATFTDTRLHPKELVYGIEIEGAFKAYPLSALSSPVSDSVNGATVRIEQNIAGGVRATADGAELSVIPGFWFSWLAVHPETELYQP